MKKITNKEEYLYQSLLMLETGAEVQLYMRDLLTEAEIREFSDRLWIAKMLNEKSKYSDIYQATKASSRTIARVSSWLRDGTGYKIVLNRLKQAHMHTVHESQL